jgi:type IV pilus assembly protein PilB
MGIKPFLVASSIQAIMAQRLVRVICNDCKEEDPSPDTQLLRVLQFGKEEMDGAKIMRGAGCKRCNNTGYRGRLGIFEMLSMNNEVRELAFNRSPTGQIRKAARAAGMASLMEDGKEKILRGITTLEEVARHAQAEGVLIDE